MDEIKISICAHDRPDFAKALRELAQKRRKRAEGLRPGMKKDNELARAIRLDRQADEVFPDG